mmetsp:Transcript_75493/g.164686  ORF Transcript_75493/g.164686 Transcript_75493/m.164686 type:complete len:238 (+) Transcript_75493:1242-1955(+)
MDRPRDMIDNGNLLRVPLVWIAELATNIIRPKAAARDVLMAVLLAIGGAILDARWFDQLVAVCRRCVPAGISLQHDQGSVGISATLLLAAWWSSNVAEGTVGDRSKRVLNMAEFASLPERIVGTLGDVRATIHTSCKIVLNGQLMPRHIEGQPHDTGLSALVGFRERLDSKGVSLILGKFDHAGPSPNLSAILTSSCPDQQLLFLLISRMCYQVPIAHIDAQGGTNRSLNLQRRRTV